jgi:hypothetical protein
MIQNSGPAVAGHALVRVSHAEEMDAFSRLGPAVRDVLNRSLLPWSSVAVVRQFEKRGLDLLNPEHDAKMAAELADIDRRRAESTRVA